MSVNASEHSTTHKTDEHENNSLTSCWNQQPAHWVAGELLANLSDVIAVALALQVAVAELSRAGGSCDRTEGLLPEEF